MVFHVVSEGVGKSKVKFDLDLQHIGMVGGFIELGRVCLRQVQLGSISMALASTETC